MGRGQIRDLAGQQFGRLTVLSIADRTSDDLIWTCQCSCGTLRRVYGRNLKAGYTTSCGCFHRERVSESNRKHGQTIGGVGPEYQSWLNAKGRCFNSSDVGYARYGARGITMAPEWIESFEAFLAHIGPRPTPFHSLDRHPNNDGNYEPGNVRWATQREQMNNTRRNRHVVINGQRLTMAEAARQYSFDVRQAYQKSRRGTARRLVPEFMVNGIQIEQAVAVGA